MAPVESEHALQQRVLYEVVVSGSLPAFDPVVTVKQKLLNPQQIKLFNRAIIATQCVIFPMYMIGFALRIPVIFAPAEIGRLLGPIALAFQFPVVFQVVFAFRFEFVKVIVGTFEFWFLFLNATIWLLSFGFYLQDARAAVTPSCWTDFVDMLLIETYFHNSQNVAIVATISAVFLLSLSVGVSLDVIQQAHNIELARLKSHAFGLKDLLANTMATMAMLLVRLSFRKYEVLRNQRRDKGLWTQSIAYRCPVRLRAVTTAPSSNVVPAVESLSSTSPIPAASEPGAAPTTPAVDPDTTGVQYVDGKPFLHMRFVRFPTIFDSELTVIPRLNAFFAMMRARRILAAAHSCAGIIGLLLIPAIFYSDVNGDEALVKYLSASSLTATLGFWTPFVCCGQRQLVARLWSSFDFLFAYMQLALAHLALCEMLSWEWCASCGVFSSFIWMQGVLTMDMVPPIMRVRLGWRPWFIVPILLLHMTMQVLLSAAVLQWKHEKFRNRLLLDSAIGGHQLRFYVIPFFLSRQFTSFVWSVRLLHRFRTRQTDDELLVMLGNVEYNYDHWKQARRQRQEARGPQLDVMTSFRQKLAARLATAHRGVTAIVPIGGQRSAEPSAR